MARKKNGTTKIMSWTTVTSRDEREPFTISRSYLRSSVIPDLLTFNRRDVVTCFCTSEFMEFIGHT